MVRTISNIARRHAFNLTALAAASTAILAAPVHASLTLPVELTETLMHAQSSDIQMLGLKYGTNIPASLAYSTYIDLDKRSFNYTLDGGQDFHGSPVSMSTSGSFDEFSGTYNWTQVGQIGLTTWTGSGSAIWDGNDGGTAGTISGSATWQGMDFNVSFTGTIEQGTVAFSSEGTFTFTGPGGVVWGPYQGTDHGAGGTWIISVDVNGSTHEVTGTYSALGGAGFSNATIEPTPGPLSLLAIAGMFARRRRQRAK